MSNIYPKGFPQRTDEFKKSQNIKQEVYNFLKDTMEEATEKAFKALGIECVMGHAGEYGDGTVYGAGVAEGGKCNVKVGSKTASYLEKQISYGGKRMFVESSFEIDGRNEMIHMIYTTTEKAVFQGHQEMKGGFFVNEDMHMSLSDMTKFKKDMKKILEDAAKKEAQYLVQSKLGVDDRIATDVTQSVVESIMNAGDDDFLNQMDMLFESDGIDEEEQEKEDVLIHSKIREEESKKQRPKIRQQKNPTDDELEAKEKEKEERRKKNRVKATGDGTFIVPKDNNKVYNKDGEEIEKQREGEEIDEITASGGGAGAGAYLTPSFGAAKKRKISNADAPFDNPVNESKELDPRFTSTPYYQRMMNDELKGSGNVHLVKETNEKGDSFWTVVDTSNFERNHIMGAMGADGVEVNSKEEEKLSKGHGSKHGGGKKKKMNESKQVGTKSVMYKGIEISPNHYRTGYEWTHPELTNSDGEQVIDYNKTIDKCKGVIDDFLYDLEQQKLNNEYADKYMQIDESVRKRYKPNREKTQEEINERWSKLTNFSKGETIREFENKADQFRNKEVKKESKPIVENKMKDPSRNQNLEEGSVVDGKKIVSVTGKRNRQYLMFEEDSNNTEKAFCFDFMTGMLVSNPNFGK